VTATFINVFYKTVPETPGIRLMSSLKNQFVLPDWIRQKPTTPAESCKLSFVPNPFLCDRPPVIAMVSMIALEKKPELPAQALARRRPEAAEPGQPVAAQALMPVAYSLAPDSLRASLEYSIFVQPGYGSSLNYFRP